MPAPTPILPLSPGTAAPSARVKSAAPTAAPSPSGDGGTPADLQKPQESMVWATIGVLSALLMYSYWPGLLNARSSWDNPQYQHGWIVPVINLALLFGRRQPISAVSTSARLAGLGLLAASLGLRVVAAYFRIVTIDMYTFVPALAGVFLLAGGWSMFRWAWAPIAMTIFMYPLPDEAQRYITGPLQTFNTTAATFILQTLGFDAIQEGNLIRLGHEHVMNVVDACAGLKMLTLFVWLCALVIVVAGLEWWENLVIAISAIPIAIMANALRITTAGMLYGVSPAIAEGFHDSIPAALLMMGVAVGFILLEMTLLSYLIVKEDHSPAALVPKVAPPSKNSGFPLLAGAPGGGAQSKSGTGHSQ